MTGRLIQGRRRVASGYGIFLTLACLAAISLTSCHRAGDAAPTLSVQQNVAPQPAKVGPAVLSITLTGADTKPITHASVTVEADMTHPGMSPVFGDVKEIAPGRYQARLNFTMGGDWVVLTHIKLANGQTVERQMDVRGVSPN
jgi:YtkA-like